jgi:uncharacterized protein YjbJ (UPF0337 family)
MISHQELAGNWNSLKGQIKSKWGQLTDNDLTQAEGNVEKLVGMIQQKTGSARREVEELLDQWISDGSSLANRATASARQYAQQAGDAVAQGYDEVAQHVQEGYEQAEEVIRARPTEALSVAFGAGIITGIVVTLLMRPTH